MFLLSPFISLLFHFVLFSSLFFIVFLFFFLSLSSLLFPFRSSLSQREALAAEEALMAAILMAI